MACHKQGPFVRKAGNQYVARFSCSCGVTVEAGDENITFAIRRARRAFDSQLKGRHNE